MDNKNITKNESEVVIYEDVKMWLGEIIVIVVFYMVGILFWIKLVYVV